MASKEERLQQDGLHDIIRRTAPGTTLREGLDNVLRANTGGLIVIGDLDAVEPLIEGGFAINAPFSPAHLYELAKMDGAIILSKDASRILFANAHLNPDPSVPSSETGIRHRSAEQTARQTNALVISISQRRRVISLYQGTSKYVLRDISVLLTTANLAVQTLERYKTALDDTLLRLSTEEFDEVSSLQSVVNVIQRAEMCKRVEGELIFYMNELGNESRLIKMQAEELLGKIDMEERLTIRDYMHFPSEMDPAEADEHIEMVIRALRTLNSEELLNRDLLAHHLGYDSAKADDAKDFLRPRGYRLLHRLPRIPSHVIDNLVAHFNDFSSIVSANVEALDEVDGVGPKRAKQIYLGLERLRSQILSDSHWQS